MRYLERLPGILLAICLTGLMTGVAMAQEPYQRTYSQTRQLINRLDNRSHTFRNRLANALDRSSVNGSAREDEMNKAAANFQQSADDLKNSITNRRSTRAEVEELLRRAQIIDTFMRNHQLASAAENNWRMLRSDLDQLASNYYVAWNWNNAMPLPYPLPYRVSDSQMQNLLSRIETKTDRFSKDMPGALDRSTLNGSSREDEINRMVTDFEYSTDQLKQRFNSRNSTSTDVQTVLQRAAMIDGVMMRNRFDARTERDWTMLKNDLNELASAYSVAWNWNGYYPPATSQIGDWQLTGTYRLDPVMSDNPRTVADRAASNASWGNQRDSIYNNLVNRLDPPQMFAIDKTGNQIGLASTRSPQVMLDANGREYIEHYPDNRTSHVRATLTGNKLTVVSNGNRANDFTATFEPIDNGRRMLVTREMYAERLNQPVRVRSYYDRTSTIAQFNIFDGSSTGYGNQVGRTFIIPDGTMVVAALNNNLSTRTARDGDRFTMTVREPFSYRNAIVEGHLTNVDRSGRFSGRANMTLNFDSIRLSNGQTYAFAGVLENFRATNGEDVRVDNEGAIAERDSQSGTTLQRSAIGGAVGALIGAIAGGGKGAAIGAVVGASAGAGSVYVQGRDDLDLSSGSEVTIRASAPGRL